MERKTLWEQKRTLVRNEGWPLIDGWYWCPESLIDARVKYWEKEGNYYTINLKAAYSKLNQRVAHACKDGRIRAGVGIQTYKKKSGMLSLYGKCKRCDEKLSDGVKTIIIMELTL